ncbi:RNA chaperone ProQ [Oceanisphaera avium]|uniref:RNA chaperone ProQ n=1 Tax=Oceanisphaera avium TaxID=1903694 RepID=A0A1Y0CVL2_9GAMM|nr:RNA chaperone ProQ [Oceanisphaera avium]ART79342.1 RNA chaperone ProQ [Oceanisphaera avium]
MENSEKLKNSKEVIAYLAERFPQCFIADGEAKPLKIGIFQDLAAELGEDPKVSKTLLRTALRQYTSSWRYLHGLKAGQVRVGLEGQACGELTEEHVEHAKGALKESKEKVFGARKDKPTAKKSKPKAKAQPKSEPKAKATSDTAASPSAKATPVDPATLKVAQAVRVVLGSTPVAGTVKEITRDDVQVELQTGLSLRVKFEHLIL